MPAPGTHPAGHVLRTGVWPVAITGVYAAVVIWTAIHHEPWRDEVVPLSIVRNASSLGDVTGPLAFEGHPLLWYLLLWGLWALIGQTWVLKAASLGSAIGAVFLVSRSPVPWWLGLLFTFSFFPLYQYSVISRGYGLEMFTLFAFCAVYPHRREHPLALAFALALLANTEAFGTIMTFAAVAMLGVEALMRGVDWRAAVRDRRLLAAGALYVVALGCAAAVALPDTKHPLTGYRQLDLASIAAGIGRAIAEPVGHAREFTLLPMPALWTWAYFAFLTRRPPVLTFCAGSLIGMETLYNLVYGPGAPWHVGNTFLVLVAGIWLDLSASTPALTLPAVLERARTWLGRLLVVAFALVLAAQVRLGWRYVTMDLALDYSSNRVLAELLRSDPSLAGAVVMGEPDTPLWSVPYYAPNPIYLVREGVFRDWGIFRTDRARDSDLASLLRAARSERERCRCPVVITMGWELGRPGTYTNFPGTRFEEHFVVTQEALDEFLAATQPLARLRGPTGTDENYDVFVLR